jgi:hypothetical protein
LLRCIRAKVHFERRRHPVCARREMLRYGNARDHSRKNWFGDMRSHFVPIDWRCPASRASKAMGEWRKRSLFLSCTTVIRVVNGNRGLDGSPF